MINLSYPQLNGKIVNLREPSIDDAIDIVNIMSYDIAKYLYDVPYPYKIDDAFKFIKSSYDNFRLHKAITFVIEYKNKSQSIQPVVGTIAIKDIDYVNEKTNIGYWIGEQYHGKGIATECVNLVVNFGFDVLELKEISAYVFPENKITIRVLEKNEFVRTKEVNEYHSISNTYRNSLVYIIKNNNK